MDVTGFNATSRQLILALPFFMGCIEWMLRLALDPNPDYAFFPASLMAGGIALFIALTAMPARPDDRHICALQRYKRMRYMAQFGIWAAVFGTTGWIYLVMASLSESVKATLPYHPVWYAVLYYLLGVLFNELKARIG
jgi:hypothetical protein